MDERNQFTFYASFFKALRRIKDDAARAMAYDAICAYALNGDEPDLDELPDIVALCFDLVRPNLDSARRKSKGGQDKDTDKIAVGCPQDDGKIAVSYDQDTDKIAASCDEDTDKITASYPQDTANKKKKEKEIEKEIEKKKEIENKSLIARGARFSPPTADEVRAYCQERRNAVDADAFIDFYASKGWKVGNQPMKDWRAAVRTWEQRTNYESAPRKPNKITTAAEAARRPRNMDFGVLDELLKNGV